MIDWVSFQDTQARKCDSCREIYTSRTPPEPPPCKGCRVDLLEENAEVASVFIQCRGQLIITQGQIIDLSIPAVKIVMDLMGVEDQRECLNRVMRLFHQINAERDAEQENESR